MGLTALLRFQTPSSNLNQTETHMSRTHTIAALLIAVIVSAFVATEAHAFQRTHVSAAIGNDANTAIGCTATSPCRFFQAAMTITDPNGEVVVLDSGGYGAVKITQSSLIFSVIIRF